MALYYYGILKKEHIIPVYGQTVSKKFTRIGKQIEINLKFPVYSILPKYPSNRNMAEPMEWFASNRVTVKESSTRMGLSNSRGLINSAGIWLVWERSFPEISEQYIGRDQELDSPLTCSLKCFYLLRLCDI